MSEYVLTDTADPSCGDPYTESKEEADKRFDLNIGQKYKIDRDTRTFIWPSRYTPHWYIYFVIFESVPSVIVLKDQYIVFSQ